ncbi:MAG: T9SS type A sorting domain-containing protein [Bacteroidetes bacterium]|nr:T9SS type A sorting domain-containing protein [Bacteroidota bacterium]
MRRARIYETLLLLLFIFLLNGKSTAQTISPVFFGQNAWMPDTIGDAAACSNPPCVLYGKLHKQWTNIKNSNTAIVRFGGIATDKNRPTNFQYIKMIDSIRAKGMEPVLQVPFHLNQYTAQQAAAIVQYVNITKGKKIKYWIIGNEPDLGYSYTTAAQIAAYFKPFASAMKAVDPTILTIGPECAWYNTGIINGLTTPNGPDDITGTDANGRYYCDIISFHAYAFNGTQTRAQVLTKLTSTGSLQDNLIALNARIANCNAVHGRSGTSALRTAITEANVNYQNSATDNLNGTGANSFIGGQFVAEMLAIGMKNNVNFINVWSVIEGNTNALNIGYIDAPTGNKKPLYYHFKMLAENFKGNFLNGITNQPNVKAFGSDDGVNINVMVMNQELATDHNFTIRLNSAAVTGTNALKINVNAALAIEYNDAITNQTTILLTFNKQGVLTKKCIYSLANHALNNLPPSCESVTGALPISLLNFDATPVDKAVQLKWLTASETENDFFTVQKSKSGTDFEDVAIVNGAGTSHEYHSYATSDESPFEGTSYYRLKQTDFEGGYSYSEMRTVTFNQKNNMLLVYPNPSDGTLIHVQIKNSDENSEVTIKLYDGLGKEIEKNSRKISDEGTYEVELTPASTLPKGVYVILVSVNNMVYKSKLVVK